MHMVVLHLLTNAMLKNCDPNWMRIVFALALASGITEQMDLKSDISTICIRSDPITVLTSPTSR